MLPLKDTLRTTRRPVATLVAVPGAVLTIWPLNAEVATTLLAAWALWIAGRSVEDAAGRLGLIIFWAVIGGATAAVNDDAVALVCAAGTVGLYVRLYPRARIQTLILIPLAASIVEAPVSAVIVGWVAVLIGLAAAGFGDVADLVAAAAAALLGALILPLMRPRRNAAYC